MPLTLKITEQERAKRLNDVAEALASVRLEGLEPGHDVQAIYQRFADGEITLEEARTEVEFVHDRKYGPVSVPRNERS